MLGEKRNIMMSIASGEYIVFVDDDDRIIDNYISDILQKTQENKDCIVFNASVSINGEKPKICHYSIYNQVDYNTSDAYYRLPNHICAVKREIAIKAGFPPKLYGEDSGYSKSLLPLLADESVIPEVLYYYDFNSETTETQMHLKPRKNEIDLIFLNDSQVQGSTDLLNTAVNTALTTATHSKVNVIVVEQSDTKHTGVKTININEPFNYNKFANTGASQGRAGWIMIANNDLVFTKGWDKHLIDAIHPLVSPKAPNDPRQADITRNTIGIECGRHFSGWCFMIQRSLWLEIGGFDEHISFYCSDNATIEQCVSKGVKPMLVPSSVVYHLGSQTLQTKNTDEVNNLTFEQVYKFNNKYNKEVFKGNKNYENWKNSYCDNNPE